MKNNFNQLNRKDLEKELSEKRVAIRNLRFGMAGSKSKNVKEQKKIKKEVAQILTALNKMN